MNETGTNGNGKTSFWDTTTGTITKITALLTAITGLILAVKPFLSSGEANHGVNNDPQQQTTTQPTAAVDYNSVATSLANDWCNNLKSKNVDALVEGSSLPFYADKKILNSLHEVRQSYEMMVNSFSQRQLADSFHIETERTLAELKVYKISELKSKGYDMSGDRLLRSLNLEDDPYIAMVRFSDWNDYTEIVFRKTGNTLKIAGWWN